ncbi:MAG: 4-hydroxy-tetrahydrodipicolinate reductase [Acetobacteraceae bacterium]|nr:4-hydroxy-tetrahydrodipicolinate reductase [Acetobacteraceae bacterium]
MAVVKIRVILAGATGRMGREIGRAIAQQPDLTLTAAVALDGHGRDVGEFLGLGPLGVKIVGRVEEALASAPAEVLVDFTAPDAGGRHALCAARAGVSPVVGTTGIEPSELEELEELCLRSRLGAVVVPNFSLGAYLLGRLAEQAVRYLPACEIVEMHHQAKRDAPSGTARRLAQGLGRGGRPVPVHSVRLPGLMAHHWVIFGGDGETLTIAHDTLSRSCYVPGVLAAVRRVRGLKRMVTDLGEVLDWEPA